MDAFTTNSSYWRSSGLALQQWIMYSYNTHTATHLKCGFKFRTTSVLNDRILFSKDGPVIREWFFLQLDQKLQFSLFKTNGISQLTPIADANYHNDGKWHEVEIEWNSNGAGLGGMLTATVDGVTTNYDTPTIDSIQFGTQSICLNGRDGGYGPIVFDCEYVMIDDRRWTFSSLYSTIVYSNDGEKYFQSVGQTLANVWKLSTDSYVKPYNFINGGYRYTNGVPAEDIILPKLIEKAYLGGSSLVTNENALWGCKLKSEFFGVYKGIEFRFLESSSTTNYYKVIINQDKGYNISVSLRKTVDGTSTVLTFDYAEIEHGVDIDLRIERNTETNSISIFINDVLVRSYTDSTFTSGEKSTLYTSGFHFVSAYAGSTQFTFSPAYLKYVGLTAYLSYTVIPPLSFNNVETAFYLPFNQKVEDRDTESKLYDHETDTPNKVYYSDLVNDGFGDKIVYKDNGNNSFSNFKVKR